MGPRGRAHLKCVPTSERHGYSTPVASNGPWCPSCGGVGWTGHLRKCEACRGTGISNNESADSKSRRERLDMKDNDGAALGGTLDSLVGRRTVKSRCPICDGVIDSAPIKYGVKAMMACPHCATMVVLDVEDVMPNNVLSVSGERGERND